MAKSGSALSILGAWKGIRSMEINKTAKYPDIALTTGNRPTLPQCGKKGVVLYILIILMTLNVNDDHSSVHICRACYHS